MPADQTTIFRTVLCEEKDVDWHMEIVPYVSFGSIPLGESKEIVLSKLGSPDGRRINKQDEVELDYGHTVVRLDEGGFVLEVTSRPDFVSLKDDRISRHELPEYLRQADTSARESFGFVISRQYGIAVDTDTQNDGWISVFVEGRWDEFISKR